MVQTSNTIAFPEQRSARARRRLINAETYTNLRLKLSNSLQSTLDLSELLKLFFDGVKEEVRLGGISYRNESTGQTINLGRSSAHKCHYDLVTAQGSLGELTISRSRKFSEKELQFMELLIGCLILPLRNSLVYREALVSALRDPLTDVGNRVAMEHSLKRDIALSKRHNHPLSILVVDVDHFKKVNDTYGHAIGDRVLTDVADQIKRCCRDTDACFRYGGEEFVVALNQTDLEGAKIIAERLRSSIDEMSTTCNDKEISVTASIGASEMTLNDTLVSLFDRADKALYAAKNSGRNRTVLMEQDGKLKELN